MPEPLRYASPVTATSYEHEHLLRVIESGAELEDRHQLFLWARGPLQALLPHDILVCMQLDAAGKVAYADSLHADVRSPLLNAQLLHPQHGLCVGMASEYRRMPLACPSARPTPDGQARPVFEPSADIVAALARHRLPHPLASGTGPLAGSAASFFVLLGRDKPATHRCEVVLGILLPFLHLAVQRIRAPSDTPTGTPLPATLTAREDEILHWVRQGKNNQEIGLITGVRALTVKSHLQNIFRKLNVHTRAQAVSAMPQTEVPAGGAGGRQRR